MKTFIFLFLFLIICSNSFATVRYVKFNAMGANDGSSWTNAYTDLQSALAVSMANDEVWVAQGTYKPGTSRTSSFIIPNQVKVYGGFLGNETLLSSRVVNVYLTILSGEIDTPDKSDNVYHVVRTTNVNVNTLLDGFTITRGNADKPGPSIVDNQGGGWYNLGNGSGNSSNPTVRNCKFIDNHALFDGGGFASYEIVNGEAGGVFENCIFEKNGSEMAGAGLYISNLTVNTNFVLRNVAFIGNEAPFSSGFGGGCYLGVSGVLNLDITNCSFVSNLSVFGGGIYCRVNSGNALINLRNTLIWNNIAGAYPSNDNKNAVEVDGAHTLNIEHSLVQTYTSTASGNISGNTDPQLFSSPLPPLASNAIVDFRLLKNSPLINAGTNVGTPTVDAFNRTRTSTHDIGAHEFRGNTLSNIIFVNDDAPDGGSGTSWAEALRTIQVAQSIYKKITPNDSIWVAKGTYFPTNTDDRSISFLFSDQIKIFGGFAGTENPVASSLITRNFELNRSILSGDIGIPNDSTDNSFHVVKTVLVGTSTVIDGFTIERGQSTGQPFSNDLDGAGWYNVGTGGNSSPTIKNCTFRKNYARFGAGIRNDAFQGVTNPLIENCSFYINNCTDEGGGIYNFAYDNNSFSNPTITNCRFAGNTAFRGAGLSNYGTQGGISSPLISGSLFFGNKATTSGAGINNNSLASPTVVNCTFSGNYAEVSGAGIYSINLSGNPSNPQIVNCIFWNNYANGVPNPGVYDLGIVSTVTYSMQQGVNSTANNNIPSVNPLFTQDLDPLIAPSLNGDFSLQNCSPIADKGSNAALPAFLLKDIVGNQRIVNDSGIPTAVVDLGAYEHQGFSAGLTETVTQALSGTQRVYGINHIEASNLINPNASVIYKASKSITLKPGFETQNYPVFKTIIGSGCEN